MGLATCALFVEHVTVDELLARLEGAFDYRRTGERLDFAAASSHRLGADLAAGRVRDWTVLWDAAGRFVLKDALYADVSRGTRALALALGGAESFGFALYKNQKCVRRLLYSAARSSESVGAPLPVEKSHAGALDEPFVWRVLEHVTSVRLRTLQEQDFERLRIAG